LIVELTQPTPATPFGAFVLFMNPTASYLNDSLLYFGQFLSKSEADELEQQLQRHVPWQQERIRMMGRWILQPRLTAWYGDADAQYTYAGLVNQPLPWLPELAQLRKRVESAVGLHFNSVLLNLYRNGRDYMGWHADDERALGRDPVIASLSLGAARRFCLRPREAQKRRESPFLNASEETLRIVLEPGSLLLMQAGIQHRYKHALPKALRVTEPRINLTFRRILGGNV